jgi:predicted transcriptional regulator of viral defense system
MRLIDVHARLLKTGQPLLQTSDAAAFLRINVAHASKLLGRLATAGLLAKLGRGKWGFKDRIDPFALPEYLTAPFPSYVSLQSALFHHGLISQIPSVLYAVSLARTKTYRTPAGTVSVHHLDPSFFFGYRSGPKAAGKIATPEFKAKSARDFIRRIRSVRRRSRVSRLFEILWKGR